MLMTCASVAVYMGSGVALKIMQLYRCVEGRYWLGVDMRLECYTAEWFAFAIYGAVCGVVFIVGFPLGVLVILCRHKRDLETPEIKLKYGFLYEVGSR